MMEVSKTIVEEDCSPSNSESMNTESKANRSIAGSSPAAVLEDGASTASAAADDSSSFEKRCCEWRYFQGKQKAQGYGLVRNAFIYYYHDPC
jgi:hypothetical protein